MLSSNLPDVSTETRRDQLPLSFVGMNHIRVLFQHPQGGSLPVDLQVGVNLRTAERGIHMSRLYRIVQNRFGEKWTSWNQLPSVLEELLQSHSDLSDEATLQLSYELPRTTKALVSGLESVRLDPITVRGVKKNKDIFFSVRLQITFSSTCPASAALSRVATADAYKSAADQISALNWREWSKDWIEHASIATAHAQRSRAMVDLQLQPSALENFSEHGWIEELEAALGTAVQDSVKRVDEQEFAKRNAQNLMFCEDSARRLAQFLSRKPEVLGFRVQTQHFESLHAHDAVATVQGGTLISVN